MCPLAMGGYEQVTKRTFDLALVTQVCYQVRIG
jgi:hypothetical protein